MRIEIKFVDGLLAGSFFTAYESRALTQLLDLCVAQKVATLIAIKKEGNPDQETMLYFDGLGVCLFRDTGNMILDVWQDEEYIDNKLVGVVDARWEITYFLPTQSFVQPDRAIIQLASMLESDEFEPTISIPQEGEEVRLAYSAMESGQHSQ